MKVTATDADDPTYGNSARVVYSILHGQPYFSVDPKTGECFTVKMKFLQTRSSPLFVYYNRLGSFVSQYRLHHNYIH